MYFDLLDDELEESFAKEPEKLKKEIANLLGGRAFEYSLMPLAAKELGDKFNIENILNYGSLPAIFAFSEVEDKIKFLRSYVRSYVKTIQLYYLVLEETYLGFRLPSFHHSIRKSQLLSPKFYFFDIGAKRALEQSLHAIVVPGTSYYGEVFEHFLILEFYRLNQYYESNYRLSFFTTKEGAEVDLVLTRGKEIIFLNVYQHN